MSFEGPPDEDIYGFPRSAYVFPVDPELKINGAKFAGALPSGHPRRCQGTKRDRVSQCPFHASRGSLYCAARHRGKQSAVSAGSLRGFYSRRAGPALRDLIDQLGKGTREERMRLDDEIDLTRIACAESLKLFDLVFTNPETAAKASTESKALAVECLRGNLKAVSDIVTQAARIQALASVDPEGVDAVIGQVLKIIEDRLANVPSGPELIQQISDDLAAIRVTKKEGTTIVLA